MSTPELASILVACATLVSALASLAVALRTGSKVDATHTLVNGQSGALNALTGKAAYAEGVLAGQTVTASVDEPTHPHSDRDQQGAD